MDDDLALGVSAQDIQRLSPSDQKEIASFVEQQQQQANVQRSR